jgi:hypothetical protein
VWNALLLGRLLHASDLVVVKRGGFVHHNARGRMVVFG